MEPSRIPVDLASQAGLYRSILAGKKVMLVLDNARDEDQVRPLFPGSGGSLVIVTSRRQLTGLAAADGASLLTLDVLTGDEARELLARRVGRERISAEPDAAGELTRLCARLPLALSIAAARAAARPNLPLASLAAGLRDECRRLDLLDGGETASSVRSAFSWSYRTLTLAAARMFRLLGLHPGPDITVPAAASLAAVTAGQAGAGLAELERAHLITEQAPGRFTFHDLLRAYAAGQARAEDSETERRAAIHRTLDHYLHTASAGAMLLNPARDQVALTSPAEGVLPEDLAGIEQALTWFEAERDVLLAAIIKASRSGFAAHAWGIPAALTDFLERCGRWEDWTRTQRTALSAARQLGDLPAQALAHRNLGRALGRLGRYDSALAHLGHALRLHGQLGDAQSQARAYLSIDWILAEQRRYQEALGAARQALRLFQVSDDRAGQARALNNAGSDHASLGQYQQALECCQQALALHQGLGDRHGAAANWDSLGYVHHQLGHYQEAAACYRRALALCRDLDDHYSQAEVLSHLADTLHAIGTDGAAREAWQQALAILDGLHHPEARQIRARLDRTECRGPSGDR
ncbi:MAG TPA: tetratricopeptide repeat protein [Streptosporangiaceae bacterium]|nr:tetratricopeptide repeat protein [Streptosporangiaceae bacterium]